MSSGSHRSSPIEFQAISRCANRVNSMDLHLPSAEMRQVLQDPGLSLENVSQLRLRTTSPESGMIHLQVAPPSLSCLILEGVTIKWSAISNLTHLHLCKIDGSSAPSTADLRSILRLSPSIHTLVLDRVNIIPTIAVFHVYPNQLQQLRINLNPIYAKKILRGVKIPPATQVELEASTHDLEEILGHHDQRRHHIRTPALATLSLESKKIVLSKSTSAPFSEDGYRIIIRLVNNMDVRALNPISKVFTLNNIKTLELKFMHPDHKNLVVSLQILRDFLKPMRLLTTLRVSQALAGIVVPILGESSMPDNVICPNLWWLYLGDPDQYWWGFPQRLPVLLMVDGSNLSSMGCTRGQHVQVTAVGGVEFLGKGKIEIDYAQMRLRNFVGGVESHLTNL